MSKPKVRYRLLPPTEQQLERKSSLKLALTCFGVSAGLMALIYFCIGVPFLGNSVLVLDLNGQYVYFFESLHDIVYNGNASLLWSWARSLGGEYMGIFAYYLASPFSWLVALMPSAVITESLYVMILAKVGLAGGCMGWYLHKTYPTNRRNVILFSAMYALCAWSMMYGNNVMWLDAFYLFPLVIWGADLLLSGRNYLVYTLCLALTVLSNFYMGYMVCIFLVLYFFYFHIARRGDPNYNPFGRKAHFLRSGLRYLFFSLLSLGISAVIILCAAYSLTFGKNTFTDPVYEFSFKLTFLDIVYKLLPGAVDTVRREGLPFIYCGTAALFGISIFFASEKIKIKEKFGAGLLFLVLCLCFSVSVIDIWWHGGQEPNWLNYRYSFIFSFFLLVCGYRGFEELEKTSSKFLAATPAVIFVFYVILQKFEYGKGYEYTDGILPHAYSYDLLFYFLGVLVVGVVFAGILYFKKNAATTVGAAALCGVILGEAVAMGVLHQVGLACDVGYSGRVSYADFIDRVQPGVNYINDMDQSFYRMDKTFHRQPADAMALEMRSLSSTTSTLNRRTLALLSRLGYAAGSYWSEYRGENPATDMLLDVKYILSDNTTPDSFYQRIYTDDERSVYGYLNPYALSLAYGISEEALDLDFASYSSPIELINNLFSSMTGDQTLLPFEPIENCSLSTDNLKKGYSSSSFHDVYTPQDQTGGSLVYTFQMKKTAPAYLFIPTDYPRECSLLLDGKEWGTIMGNDSDCIISLGILEEGSTHSVTVSTVENKIYMKEKQTLFWTLNEETVRKSYEVLFPGCLRIDDGFQEDHLTGTVTVSEERTLLFTSIPYDQGWNILVDGQKVEPLLFDQPIYDGETGKETGKERIPYGDALILLRLTPGAHRIEFQYRPACFVYGNYISLASSGLLLMIVLLDYLLIRPLRRRKKRIAALQTENERVAADQNEDGRIASYKALQKKAAKSDSKKGKPCDEEKPCDGGKPYDKVNPRDERNPHKEGSPCEEETNKSGRNGARKNRKSKKRRQDAPASAESEGNAPERTVTNGSNRGSEPNKGDDSSRENSLNREGDPNRENGLSGTDSLTRNSLQNTSPVQSDSPAQNGSTKEKNDKNSGGPATKNEKTKKKSEKGHRKQ